MEYIKERETYSLSNKDILKLTNNKCNVYVYDDLFNFKTIDEAFGKHGAFVVLYQTSPFYGHWCACIKINNKLIEFFDPISSKPDREFNNIIETYRRQPYLKYLMASSPYKLSYNEYKFQKSLHGINTCGRWCALRVICRKYSLEQFKQLVTDKKYDPDFMVTLYTELLF